MRAATTASKIKLVEDIGIGAIVMVSACAIFGLVAALWNSFYRGFDITDESFYLLNIWFPRDNIGAVTEFGYYLHLFGKNIIHLRLLGLAGILITSSLLSYHLFRLFASSSEHESDWRYLAMFVSAIMLSSFSYYRYLLVTPSYQWFTYLGAVVTATSAAHAVRMHRFDTEATEGSTDRSTLLVSFGIGLGTILTTIGRPTSGLSLGLVIGTWCALTMKPGKWLRIGVVAIGLCVAFFVFHVLLVEPSVSWFFENASFAINLAASLDVGHSIGSAASRLFLSFGDLPKRLIAPPLAIALAVTLGLAVFAFAAALAKPTYKAALSKAWRVGLIATVACFIVAFYERNKDTDTQFWPGPLGLDLNILLAWAAVLAFIEYRFSPEPYLRMSDRVRLSYWIALLMVPLLTVLALVISFGSTSEMVDGSGTVYILYASSALILAATLFPYTKKIGFYIVACLISLPNVFLIHTAMQKPYRLPFSIADQNIGVKFLDGINKLKVDERTAAWVNGLLGTAQDAGWKPGNALIDLSGGTPGAAVVLSARTPTTPWLVGGYPGSNDFVRMALARANPEQIRSAWILTAPKGDRRINAEVLHSVGRDLVSDYTCVGKFLTGHRNELQYLWKPRLPTQRHSTPC